MVTGLEPIILDAAAKGLGAIIVKAAMLFVSVLRQTWEGIKERMLKA